MKIKAAVVYEANKPYVIEEVDLAEPKAGEVLVKVAASGYCHTDEMIAGRENSPLFPIVLGHEGSGIVEKVGPGVQRFAPGDRVSMSFSYCNECFACITGRPYACEQNGRLNFGGRSYDGTTRLTKDGVELSNFFNQASFATHSVTHENNLVKIPDDMDLALAAPLGCGVQTGAGAVLNNLKPEPGSAIVIQGLGGVGMSALMAAKVCGCSTIVAVDTVDYRLDVAMEVGATHVVNAKKNDVVAFVKDLTKGLGADYAVAATGAGANAREALRCTGYFGGCAIIGSRGEMTLDIGFDLGGRLITGITEGCCIPSLFIPKLIHFYQNGRFPLDKIVKRYDFEDINKAAADSHSGATIKPVLVMKG